MNRLILTNAMRSADAASTSGGSFGSGNGSITSDK